MTKQVFQKTSNHSLSNGFNLQAIARFSRFMLLILGYFAANVVAAQAPTITNFSPATGVVGATVTLTGTNFNTTAANNVVYFGQTKASVTAASATSLTVTVPSGASYAPISVLNTATKLIGLASTPFVPVFAPIKDQAMTAYDFQVVQNHNISGVNAYTHSIVAGDLSGDNKPDIAVGHKGSRILSTLQNNTGITDNLILGTLSLNSGGTNAYIGDHLVESGDLDGDGKLDIICGVSVNYTTNLLYYLKNTSTNGSINLANSGNLTVNGSIISIALSDLDGDGKLDIVVGSTTYGPGYHYLSVFRNTTANGNLSFAPVVNIGISDRPASIAIGDLDGDGKPDIAVANYSSVSIFRNTATSGNLTSSSFVAESPLTPGGSVIGVAIGDLNMDGKLDLAVANNVDVAVLNNTTAKGSLFFATPVRINVNNPSPSSLKIADMNGDGKPDLITTDYIATISILQNTSVNGTTAFDFNTSLSAAPSNPVLSSRGFAISDFNADSRPDIIFGPIDPNVSFKIFMNNPIFSPTVTQFTPTTICETNNATINITGTNFKDITAVTIAGINADSFKVNSTTSITAYLKTTAKTGVVTVKSLHGTGTSTSSFVFNVAVTPSVSIATASPTTVCAGKSVVFTATPTNGGTNPTYQWKKGGVNVGSNSPTYTDAGTTSGAITCTMTVGTGLPCLTATTAISSAINLTVTPNLPPSVSIAITSGKNPTCAGTSVTFTATPTNGGTNPIYQWKKGGVNVGTNSPTYTDAGATAGAITCTMTVGTGICTTVPTATSNTLNLGITPLVTPSVAIGIKSGTNPTCRDNSITLRAIPTNGGAKPLYIWFKGTTVVSNDSVYTDAGTTSGLIYCGMQYDASLCVNVSNSSVTSPPFSFTVLNKVTPSVAIGVKSGTNPTCSGTSVTFRAIPTNGGTNPKFQWTKGTNVVGSDSTYTDAGTTAGALTCTMTVGTGICPTAPTATSTTTNLTITPTTTPSVSIAITTGFNPTCLNKSVTFTATPTNGGTNPTYQWKKGGVNVGTNSPTYTDAGATAGAITCTMTIGTGVTCPTATTVTSAAINLSIATNVIPSVAIALTTGTNPTCSGKSVTFTATPTNGGTNPKYQWRKGGVNVGTNSPTYTDAGTVAGSITCVMTAGTNVCIAGSISATSTAISLSIAPAVVPSVAIAVTKGKNPTCSGTAITFTATPTNGGTNPSYQWKKGTTNVGTNSPTYTDAGTTAGSITCVMTVGSNVCTTTSTATSAAISLTIAAIVTPSVTIAITSGTQTTTATGSVTFRATPTNGGTTPKYQWQKNGMNINNATSATFTNAVWVNNDAITCILTSTATCLSTPTATSNKIVITVRSAAASPSSNNNGGAAQIIKVYPNPVSNFLNLDLKYEQGATAETMPDYQVLNLLGQTFLSGKIGQQIDVSTLQQGSYILKIGLEQIKFVKQ